ncbi:hypothetical protein ACHAPC_009591 [Botrytis cinerea]
MAIEEAEEAEAEAEAEAQAQAQAGEDVSTRRCSDGWDATCVPVCRVIASIPQQKGPDSFLLFSPSSLLIVIIGTGGWAVITKTAAGHDFTIM